LPWFLRNLKNIQNETTKRILVGITNFNISTNQDYFVYEVLRNYPKINKFCSWNQ